MIDMFGATIQWPEQLVRVVQKSHILAFCKMWRQLRHRFLGNPWMAAYIFEPGVDYDTLLGRASAFWNHLRCRFDFYVSLPLIDELCTEAADLLDEDLSRFVWTLFSRCMVTSTFVEKTFAPMTSATNDPHSTVSLSHVQARHVNSIFDEGWQRWAKQLSPSGAIPTGRCRDLAAYHCARGCPTQGWHVYAKENKTLFE